MSVRIRVWVRVRVRVRIRVRVRVTRLRLLPKEAQPRIVEVGPLHLAGLGVELVLGLG